MLDPTQELELELGPASSARLTPPHTAPHRFTPIHAGSRRK